MMKTNATLNDSKVWELWWRIKLYFMFFIAKLLFIWVLGLMDFPFFLTSNVNINKCVSTLVPISLFFIRSFLSNLSEVCIQTGNWMGNLQPWQNSWNNLKNNLILSLRRGLSLEWLCHSQYRKENSSFIPGYKKKTVTVWIYSVFLQCETVLVLVQIWYVMDSAMCYCRYQKSQYLSSFHQCPQTSITLQFQSQVGAKSSVIDFKNSKSLNLKTIRKSIMILQLQMCPYYYVLVHTSDNPFELLSFPPESKKIEKFLNVWIKIFCSKNHTL